MSDRFFRNINLLFRGNRNSSTLDCAGENLIMKTKCCKCNKLCDTTKTVCTISSRHKARGPICFICLNKQNKI